MSYIFSAEELEDLENKGADVEKDVKKEDKEELEDKPAKAEALFGDDVEDEDLKGLTKEQVLAHVRNLRTTARTALTTIRSQQEVNAAAATRVATPAAAVDPKDLLITNDDLLTSDANALNIKIDKIFTAKAGPVLNEVWQNQSIINLQNARTSAAMPHFARYEQEIVAEAQKYPVNVTANPLTWFNLYKNVLANHTGELVEAEVKARTKKDDDDIVDPPKKSADPKNPPPAERGNGSRSKSTKKVTLTDDQRRTARSLDVSDEEYAAYIVS